MNPLYFVLFAFYLILVRSHPDSIFPQLQAKSITTSTSRMLIGGNDYNDLLKMMGILMLIGILAIFVVIGGLIVLCIRCLIRMGRERM